MILTPYLDSVREGKLAPNVLPLPPSALHFHYTLFTSSHSVP